MATHQSKAQQETVERVMHEFKHGELKTSRGKKVKNPKQAIAIGLHEAGASKYESKEKNRASGAVRPRRAATSTETNGNLRGRSYEEAKRRNIPGRSKMNKHELELALY